LPESIGQLPALYQFDRPRLPETIGQLTALQQIIIGLLWRRI